MAQGRRVHRCFPELVKLKNGYEKSAVMNHPEMNCPRLAMNLQINTYTYTYSERPKTERSVGQTEQNFVRFKIVRFGSLFFIRFIFSTELDRFIFNFL